MAHGTSWHGPRGFAELIRPEISRDLELEVLGDGGMRSANPRVVTKWTSVYVIQASPVKIIEVCTIPARFSHEFTNDSPIILRTILHELK